MGKPVRVWWTCFAAFDVAKFWCRTDLLCCVGLPGRRVASFILAQVGSDVFSDNMSALVLRFPFAVFIMVLKSLLVLMLLCYF